MASDDERIDYEERAAIVEFEGAVTQHEAERLAMTCTAAAPPNAPN